MTTKLVVENEKNCAERGVGGRGGRGKQKLTEAVILQPPLAQIPSKKKQKKKSHVTLKFLRLTSKKITVFFLRFTAYQ